jgi:hypothetical protein
MDKTEIGRKADRSIFAANWKKSSNTAFCVDRTIHAS